MCQDRQQLNTRDGVPNMQPAVTAAMNQAFAIGGPTDWESILFWDWNLSNDLTRFAIENEECVFLEWARNPLSVGTDFYLVWI